MLDGVDVEPIAQTRRSRWRLRERWKLASVVRQWWRHFTGFAGIKRYPGD
jgi:hypothetical protein